MRYVTLTASRPHGRSYRKRADIERDLLADLDFTVHELLMEKPCTPLRDFPDAMLNVRYDSGRGPNTKVAVFDAAKLRAKREAR